jgi:hypothetical protein
MALGKKTGGRKMGTPNKTTGALKDAILTAAEEALPGGKVGYLKWLAKNNSGAFASLLGKVLPTTLAGDPANPILPAGNVDLSGYSDADLETMRRIMSKGKGAPMRVDSETLVDRRPLRRLLEPVPFGGGS